MEKFNYEQYVEWYKEFIVAEDTWTRMSEEEKENWREVLGIYLKVHSGFIGEL